MAQSEQNETTAFIVAPTPRHHRDIRIPMSTILKVIGSGLALWAIFLLWPEFLMFLVAVLMAVTLHPAVHWMEEKRVGRTLGVAIIAALAVALLAVFVALILPPLTAQMTHLLKTFQNSARESLARFLRATPGSRRSSMNSSPHRPHPRSQARWTAGLRGAKAPSRDWW